MKYQFAGYRYDSERGLEGAAGRVPLRKMDSRLLQLLLEADGRVVSKDSIVRSVWDDRPVTDDSIFQAVHRLRIAMPATDGADIIQTVYGSGVRLGRSVRARRAGAVASVRAVTDSDNVRAVASLMSARELSAGRSPENLLAAVEAAREALREDRGFIAAWCALAEFQVFRATRMAIDPRQAGVEAVTAAQEALALDPDCAPALAVRGWVAATIERDVAKGMADLDRSIAIDDRYWAARGMRGWALATVGRLPEAIADIGAALEWNPRAIWINAIRAQYRFFAGHGGAALAEARDAIRLFPTIDHAYVVMSMVASGLGLHEEAIAAGRRAMELAPHTPFEHTALACALARARRHKEAAALVRGIENSGFPLPGVGLAPAYLAFGQPDRAIEMVRRARDVGSPQFGYAFVDPRLAELRNDPLFTSLREARTSAH